MSCNNLKEDLTRDEGLRLKAYRDTNGFWTIGVGHLLGKSEVPRIAEITLSEAMALLEVDIEIAKKLVAEVFGTNLICDCVHDVCNPDRVRYRALVNMAFNRGGNMKTSTTITPAIKTAFKTGDWSLVTSVIVSSPWAQQIGKRANRLAYMLETGKDPV